MPVACITCAATQLHAISLEVSALQIAVSPLSEGTAALPASHLPQVNMHFLRPCACQLPVSGCLELEGCAAPQMCCA